MGEQQQIPKPTQEQLANARRLIDLYTRAIRLAEVHGLQATVNPEDGEVEVWDGYGRCLGRTRTQAPAAR